MADATSKAEAEAQRIADEKTAAEAEAQRIAVDWAGKAEAADALRIAAEKVAMLNFTSSENASNS